MKMEKRLLKCAVLSMSVSKNANFATEQVIR